MGYNTTFYGRFTFNKKLEKNLYEYLKRFSQTRRMKRNNNIIKKECSNWEELCFNSNLGKNGEYFAPVSNRFGQDRNDSIVDYNTPPNSQPGLWCNWIPVLKDKKDEDNIESLEELECYFEWNQVEKFYNYVEWLIYEIDNFIKPSGLSLNGAILAIGEESSDISIIIVNNNKVIDFMVPNATQEKREKYCDDLIKTFDENEIIKKDIETLRNDIVYYEFE